MAEERLTLVPVKWSVLAPLLLLGHTTFAVLSQSVVPRDDEVGLAHSDWRSANECGQPRNVNSLQRRFYISSMIRII